MTRRVIIDCDPGTDDAIALWLALASPEIEVSLVTVAGGNAGLASTLANASAVVGLAGRPLPIVAGADRPLLGAFRADVRVHGMDGLAGVKLPDGPAPAPGVAADAIREQLRNAAPASVTLLGIAAATNLALALATEPALADRVEEIVLMTGAVGEGNWTPGAEFNAAMDPEALAILLASGRPVTLTTLELTAQALVTEERIAALRSLEGGLCLAACCDIMDAVPPSRRLNHRGHPLHDPCAVAWIIAPRLFTARDVAVQVECGTGPGRGRTHIDRWGRSGVPPHARLLETIDPDGFFALLGERLTRLP
ncbi:nucleoside hydrolase [Roseomonas marmotae]|uniref:Nucleoside hydrolase n=1 Tax=Roseomonas marmotae TaxID=2768161 RepID=A0ABS3KC46_9PROT|nr:nucleoside hydrolase [Roseomonas marmotae]MBO1074480.1 nucleoside hydrolase [Roseomonas marmotae]QTI78212.1 nucleoside hydrolase [Roseomonas marmotae]